MNAKPGKLSLSKMLFFLSVLFLAYMSIARSVDMYAYNLTGALFEMTFLPSVFLIVVIAIITLIGWIKERLSLRSFNFYSFLLSLLSLTIVFFPERG